MKNPIHMVGHLERLARDIEWPIIGVLADMEMAGIELDQWHAGTIWQTPARAAE